MYWNAKKDYICRIDIDCSRGLSFADIHLCICLHIFFIPIDLESQTNLYRSSKSLYLSKRGPERMSVSLTGPCSVVLCPQLCCYSRAGGLVTRRDGSAGQSFLYHPLDYPERHRRFDLLPREWCCDRSDNCRLYHAVRPIDTCENFQPPSIGRRRSM